MTTTITSEAKRYIDAAARCLHMQHLYLDGGYSSLSERVAEARAKQCRYVAKACELTGETPSVIHAYVVNKCDKIEACAW